MKLTNYLHSLLPLLLSAACLCQADTPVEILKRARSGDRIAMRQIGRRLIQGDGVPREVSSGIGWLEKAAGEGDDVAMLMLGDIYRNGIGVSKNMRKAIRYYEQAERAGSEVAIKRLKKYRPETRKKGEAGDEKKSEEPQPIRKEDQSKDIEEIFAIGDRAAASNSSGDGLRREHRNVQRDDHVLNKQDPGGEFRGASKHQRKKTHPVDEPDGAVLPHNILEVDFNARDRSGQTLLHIAASKGEEGDVRTLLNAGADPHAKDNMGKTPLHLAAAAGSEDVIKLLIAAGAAPDAEDEIKATPLHYAAIWAHPSCIKELLEAGANPNVFDDAYGASGAGVTGPLGFPWNYYCSYGTPLHRAIVGSSLLFGRRGAIKALLDSGADFNIVNCVPPPHEHKSPLYLATALKDYLTMIELLEAGADPNYGEDSLRPLQVALDDDDHLAAEILLNSGAQVLSADIVCCRSFRMFFLVAPRHFLYWLFLLPLLACVLRFVICPAIIYFRSFVFKSKKRR